MKIKKLRGIIIGVGGSFLLSSSALGDEVFDRLKGEWASESWYETLIKAKSAFKASRDGGHFSHLMFSDDGGVSIFLDSFHEGMNFSWGKSQPKGNEKAAMYEVFLGAPGDEEGHFSVAATVRFLDRDKIQFAFSEEETEFFSNAFVRIRPSISGAVNKMLVAGEYTDGAGKKCLFSDTGTFVWAGEKGEYEVNLDYVGREEGGDGSLEFDEILLMKKGFGMERYALLNRGSHRSIYVLKGQTDEFGRLRKDALPALVQK